MCSARIRQIFLEHLECLEFAMGRTRTGTLHPLFKLNCKLRLFDAITKTRTYNAKMKLPNSIWLSDISVRLWKCCLDHVATPQFASLFEIVVGQVQKPSLC